MRGLTSSALLTFLAGSLAIAACTTPVDLEFGDPDETPTPTPSPSGTVPNGVPLVVAAGEEVIVNHCFPIASVSAAVVTLAAAGADPIAEGDDVIILRTQERDVITASGVPAAGTVDVTDLPDAGNYAFAKVQSIAGPTVTLTAPISPEGGEPGSQMCRVPEVPSVTIAATGRILASPWDGSSGGVVAFRTAVLSLAGEIDASGAGFRGGASNAMPGPTTESTEPDVACDDGDGSVTIGGYKGEGLAGTHSSCGRAYFATGGGGGTSQRGGGGGGSNGGFGGRSAAAVVVPSPCNVGYLTCGEGGRAVNLPGRFTLGGGGGGGAWSDAVAGSTAGGDGGRGGGLVYIEAGRIDGLAGAIRANGFAGGSSTADGAGGGGAGGTIYVIVSSGSTLAVASAQGGDGGSVLAADECGGGSSSDIYGVGGAGGGGRVAFGGGLTPDSIEVSGGALGFFSGSCDQVHVNSLGGDPASGGGTF